MCGNGNNTFEISISNLGFLVANSFHHTAGLEWIIEEIIVVWSILVTDGLDNLLSQYSAYDSTNWTEFSEQDLQHRIVNLGHGNLHLLQSHVSQLLELLNVFLLVPGSRFDPSLALELEQDLEQEEGRIHSLDTARVQFRGPVDLHGLRHADKRHLLLDRLCLRLDLLLLGGRFVILGLFGLSNLLNILVSHQIHEGETVESENVSGIKEDVLCSTNGVDAEKFILVTIGGNDNIDSLEELDIFVFRLAWGCRNFHHWIQVL